MAMPVLPVPFGCGTFTSVQPRPPSAERQTPSATTCLSPLRAHPYARTVLPTATTSTRENDPPFRVIFDWSTGRRSQARPSEDSHTTGVESVKSPLVEVSPTATNPEAVR